MSQLSQDDYRFLASPSGFGRVFLGKTLYDWQAESLDAISPDGARVAMRTCNESGKTSVVVAISIIWHMALFPNSVTVSTAGVYRQVKDQLMPALSFLLSRHPKWKVLENTVKAPNGSKYIGFSTDKPGKFEGWHTPDAPMGINRIRPPEEWGIPEDYVFDEKTSLYMIVDEAKTVRNPIFEAIERCRPNRLLFASSPGDPIGQFYDCFHSQAGRYRKFVIPYEKCPHLCEGLKLKEIETQIETWGKDHPLTRSMVYAEFTDAAVSNMVFSPADVEAAMNNQVKQIGHDRRAAVDVSGGGDEQVLMVRQGNTVTAVHTFSEQDAMVLAARLIQHLNQYELRPEWITVDDGGIGEAVNDRLESLGWPVRRLSFGGEPKEKTKYMNIRAEMFYELSHRMKRREINIRRDDRLKQQLFWQKYKMNDKYQIKLIPKEEMPSSPDRADTLAMLFYDAPDPRSYDEYFKNIRESMSEFFDESGGLRNRSYVDNMLMEQ